MESLEALSAVAPWRPPSGAGQALHRGGGGQVQKPRKWPDSLESTLIGPSWRLFSQAPGSTKKEPLCRGVAGNSRNPSACRLRVPSSVAVPPAQSAELRPKGRVLTL